MSTLATGGVARAATDGGRTSALRTVRPFHARIPRQDRVATRMLRAGATTGVAPFAAAPSPTITFPGLGRQSLGSTWPPGTAGDVGPDVYVEAIDSGFGIFRKSDGTQLAATTFAALFGAANTGTVCDTPSSSDPAVLYDTQSDRWIVAIMAWGDVLNGPYDECIAVSTTGDPVSSAWTLYPVQLESAGIHAKYLDSPRLAMWLDGVYMAANVSDDVIGELGVQVFAFNRSDLESGSALRWQATTSDPVGTTLDADEVDGAVPTNLRSQAALPAAGTNAFLVGNSQNGNQLDIWRYHVDWVTPANSWFGKNASTTAPSTVSYGGYPYPPDDVLEPSPGNPLYPQDDSVLASAQFGADNSGGTNRQVIWTGFVVGQGTTAAPQPRTSIKWIQIRVDQTNPSNRQEGTWGPDQASRWAPGLAADRLGDLALGYSITSSSANSTAGNIYPSIRYAGRLVGDSLNQLPQTEQTLFTGSGYQCCTYEDATLNDDWGPYSAMALDPDGCTFWMANEYYDTAPTTLAQDDWKTRIGSFRYAGCTPTALATSIGSVSGTGGFGGTGTLVATLGSTTTGNSGVSGKTISFKLNGTSVGAATTNASGIATLTGVSMTGIARGTYAGAVSASFAGSTAYAASGPVTGTLTVGKGAQTIAFAPIEDHVYGDADFTLSATASSGLVVTFAASGVCNLVGGTTLHMSALGQCTVTASQAGNADYNAATNAVRTFNVTGTLQTITFPQPPDHVVGDPDFGVTATASSGLPVSFAASGACTVSGSTVHITGAGTCTITASQAGDANWNAAPDVIRSIQIRSKASQTITPFSTANSGSGNNRAVGQTQSLSLTASSGLPVSYTSTTPGTCSTGASSVTFTALGTCSVVADQPGDADWAAAAQVGPKSYAILQKGTQNITFPPPGTRPFSPDFTVSVTASSGLQVTVTSTTPSICTVTGTTVHPVATGGCGLTASQGGDANWNAANPVNVTSTIVKADQTITFPVIPDHTFGDADFTVSGTASSGLSTTFTASGQCTVSGNSVHIIAPGSCTITAHQAGDSNWNAASDVARTFAINSPTKIDQTIVFPAIADHTYGDADFTVSATATSGLTVTFTASGPCTVTGNTIHITGGGSCTVTAHQAGNSVYNPAPDVARSFNIAKANQTIAFASIPNHTFADPDFGVSASASSGLAVTFAASGSCTVSGATVHLTGAGSCTVTASQPGNGNYNAAPSVPRTFTIAKADQTISFGSIPDHTFGDADFGVTAAASSGLGVSFTASGSCTITGVTVHLTDAGSCSVTAHQSGDANYNAASDVPQSFTVAKANQTITFSAIPNHGASDPDFTISATASSGLAVSFTASGQCGVSGTTVHLTGAGSCTITAHQSGDANYNAATDVPRTFSITSNTTSTTTKLALSRAKVAQGGSVTFTATVTVASGPKPTGPARFLIDGVSVGSGNLNKKGKLILTLTVDQSKGTHPVQAIYDGSASFVGSTSPVKNLKVT